MKALDPLEIIARKRDGRELDAGEVAAMVTGVSEGSIPDYQAAAFLMAVTIRGMTGKETAALLDAFLASGEVLDFSSLPGVKADKHSTGGVGDKVSLVLAPLVASCGLRVPMVSGRGLGHTGGTLDKLESIPGFRADLSPDELRRLLRDVGCFISGQTEKLVPADRAFYALRDVTATVPSPPLILASIVSKKIAEGADALVFDVKAGDGAFMKNTVEAGRLARQLVDLAAARGVRTRALVTDMEEPLGRMVGNALEVRECLDLLEGKGPADTRELVLALAAAMLELAGEPPGQARALLERHLDSGLAREKFLAMVKGQGGDAEALEKGLPKAVVQAEVAAPESGFITGIRAGHVGRAAFVLGAGRAGKNDPVDHAAGISLLKKPGDPVKKGDKVALLHTSDAAKIDRARMLYLDGLAIGPDQPPPRVLVHQEIGGDGPDGEA